MSKTIFSLGKIYPSDFLKPDEQPRCEPVELKLIMEEDGFTHLSEMAPYDAMWGEKYWYSSGVTSSMRFALKDVVDSILPFKNECNMKWCDLASNDGTLLSYVPPYFSKVGVDPSGGEIFESAKKHGTIYKEYFGETKFETGYFDVISCVAMFYDVVDVDSFCSELYRILDDNGLIVFQMSYTPLMIRQLAFDNLCHEHHSYLDLHSMKNILERNHLEIVDCTLNDVNGGSFRLFVKKKNRWFASQTHRDVCNMRIDSLMLAEEHITWDGFYKKVMSLKDEVVSFIKKANEEGKTVMGYGASTKGNTLIQVFGLDHTMIKAIADRQPKKWGLKTVGSLIPIISEQEFRDASPDYLLVLPWHFRQEFIEREKGYLSNGGTMIFPLPKLEFVSR